MLQKASVAEQASVYSTSGTSDLLNDIPDLDHVDAKDDDIARAEFQPPSLQLQMESVPSAPLARLDLRVLEHAQRMQAAANAEKSAVEYCAACKCLISASVVPTSMSTFV